MYSKELDPKTLSKITKETLNRCRLLPWEDTAKDNFKKVYVDHLHFLFDAESIPFSLYLKVENVLIEYIKSTDFKKKYLKNMLAALLGKNDSLAIYVSVRDVVAFNSCIAHLRNKRISKLYEENPNLDRDTIRVYEKMSSMAQLVSQFGIDPKVVKKVKANVRSAVDLLAGNKKSSATLVKMLGYDKSLYDHSAMVALLSASIAESLEHIGLSKKELTVVAMCGIFHDAGQSLLPSNLVHKQGLYTDKEKKDIQQHVNVGYEFLIDDQNTEISPVVARVALEHHERFDGSGYPKGLKGRLEENKHGAHLYSRIVAVADVFSALLMETSYRKAFEPTDCLKIMIAKSAEFDPLIIKSFVNHVIGSFKESNGSNKSGRVFSFHKTVKQYYG